MRRRALLPSGSKEFQKYLIGYYPFDSDFDDKIPPFSNLIQNGIGGNITLSPGVLNNAAFCPAGTNLSIRATGDPNRHKFSLTDGVNDVPYSFSMHCYIQSVGSAQTGTIWGKGSDNSSNFSTNSEYRIGVNAAGTLIEFTKFSLGSSANRIVYTVTLPPKNTWFHLVITDNALGDVKIYINSVLQYKNTADVGTGYVSSSITSESYVGSFNALGVPTNARFLEGGLDDLGMFKNYVLTQKDIDWIWNGGNPRRLKNVS